MSFTPIHDITSVQAQLNGRYASGHPGRDARPESSLRVITRSLRFARRHDEGATSQP